MNRIVAIFALLQVGTILIGVLVGALRAGIEDELDEGIVFSPEALFWQERGVFLLGIPVAWMLVTLWLRGKERCPDWIKSLALFLGLLLFLGLGWWVFTLLMGELRHWWGMGGGDGIRI